MTEIVELTRAELDELTQGDYERLMQKLAQYQDPESAVAIYLEVAEMEKAMKQIKDIAKGRIEAHLRETGEVAYACKAGKAAYTNPKTPKLNSKAWRDACLRDPVLNQWQRAYDIAAHDLEHAQEPFKELPAPTLRITG